MTDEHRSARYSDLFENAHDHSKSDCAYCPICATISVVRNTNPEVLEHLTTAARELVLAVGLFLEKANAPSAAPNGADSDSDHEDEGKVRRIDVV